MADEESEQQSRAPAVGGAIALVAAVTVALLPVTGSNEGERTAAYLDSTRTPTICFGHTLNVRLGLTATDAQCHLWLQQDLTTHAKAVLAITPSLANYMGPLKASTDFAFNAGDNAYRLSSMARFFKAGALAQGCDAFLAWDKATVNGKLVVLSGLQKRRQAERTMCLTELAK